MAGHFYVDPLEIAQNEGIRVIPSNGLDVDGKIYKDKSGNVCIEYDSSVHPNRQRFTIAHELGHYFKGHLADKTLFRDSLQNFNLDNYDIYEVEANNFAADILMPKDKIDFLLYKEGITSIEEMAHLLRVSQTAMMYRLKNLGYIS